MAERLKAERPQPTLRLPLDLYYDLEKRATAEGMNFRAWLVILLQAWLDANPPSVRLRSDRAPIPRYVDPFVTTERT
jgi:hypothetical protein